MEWIWKSKHFILIKKNFYELMYLNFERIAGLFQDFSNKSAYQNIYKKCKKGVKIAH